MCVSFSRRHNIAYLPPIKTLDNFLKCGAFFLKTGSYVVFIRIDYNFRVLLKELTMDGLEMVEPLSDQS